MKKVFKHKTLRLIEEVTNVVMARMRAGEKMFDKKVVHQEFTKYPIKQAVFDKIVKSVGGKGITRKDIDIDIVTVQGLDEAHHIHRHPLGHALISCLGKNEGWKDPDGLHYIRAPHITRHSQIIDRDWVPLLPGDRALFYPGVPHGLQGTGYVLSVQSPPIEGRDGREDDWDLLP